ncbi:hypothetical protein [Burkholderia ubonensis]|uniref:hypothetical protein n=1 Tax=Burkholderia ubonensis TaxID=101571 RepID=UPI000ACCCDC0|nr:hypothetical protein [Burkholderia ubonensis]
MEKSLPDLILELDELNRKIRRARLQEFKATNRAAQSQRVPTAIRRQVQLALDELPGRAGLTLPEYRNRAFQGICDVARAWGGACLSKEYEGHTEPLEFVCAAGHRFSMLAHGLRLGHWCRECAYGRATVYSLDDARTIAIKRGGRCLSRATAIVARRCAGAAKLATPGLQASNKCCVATGARRVISSASGRDRRISSALRSSGAASACRRMSTKKRRCDGNVRIGTRGARRGFASAKGNSATNAR